MAWTRSTGWRVSRMDCAAGRPPRFAMTSGFKTWACRARARRTAAMINIGVQLIAIVSLAPSPDVVPGVQASLAALPPALSVLALVATSSLASLLLLINFERTGAGENAIRSSAGNPAAPSTGEPVSGLVQQMHHDLRTPLNAIIGFSDMMQQQMHGPLGSDHYEAYAAHIRQSGETLLAAIEGTLAITQRLAEEDSGSIPVATSRYDVLAASSRD